MIIKKSKSNRLALAALLALGAVGATWAYWTQEIRVGNEFETAKYDTTVTEEFTPPEDWMPGDEVNKDVQVTNSGTIPIFTKAVIHQEWIRTEDVLDVDGSVIPPAKGEAFPLTFTNEDGEQEYASGITWGDVVLLASGKTSDTDLALDTVETIEEAAGKWLMISDEPDENGDLLFYYIGAVEPDSSTPKLVDAVTMNPKLNAAVTAMSTVYDKEEEKWVTTSTKNPAYGYECAKYTMTVDAVTVQGTAAAVEAVFGTSGDNAAAAAYLSSLAE